MSSSGPLFELIQVSKRYEPVHQSDPVEVLNNLTLQVEPGESVAIVGPSGSGKSTLLNIIGTLDQPTSGEVRLDGQDLGQLDESALAALRNRKIGFVFQAHYLLPQCNVLENVLVPTVVCSDLVLKAAAPSRASRLLERVGLGNRLYHRPAQLSGGEQQRVAVVRALINCPEVILADEPTGALDRASAEKLGQLMIELNQEEQVTLIVVTHAVELARHMRRVLELRDGQVRPLEHDVG
ncbi:MAG: ABC transporter ATP-binding protein [Candidatus Omnitrophica bacterium]|nr:ABC transporter ATP-binding protein [Candidatus Omnitrophota bacterium]